MSDKFIKEALQRWRPSGIRGVPFAAWFTFSSKSPFSFDNWARDVKRPFQLVLMPGYRFEAIMAKNKNDNDLMLYERNVDKPTIVWDGFSELALFEVAYEAFGLRDHPDWFRVRHVESGVLRTDPRSASLLSRRPLKSLAGLDPVSNPTGYMLAQRAHRHALSSWCFETKALLSRKVHQNPSDRDSEIEASYWSSLSTEYGLAMDTVNPNHTDAVRRRDLANKMEGKGLVFVDTSQYTSPIRSVDLDYDKMAHRVFADNARIVQQQSQPRIERRRELARDMASIDEVKAVRPSLWSRIFG
jgi:hypothetical protein